MKLNRLAAVLWAWLAFGTTANAALIDDFGGGTPEDFYDVQTELTETGGTILGGDREARLIPNPGALVSYGVASGVATFSSEGIATVEMLWDGVDGSFAVSTSTLLVDLTDAGAADRFLVDVSSFGASGPINGLARLFGASDTDIRQGNFSIVGAGITEIPFSSLTLTAGLGASTAAATAVQFRFLSQSNSAGVSVDAICTGVAGGDCSAAAAVPEPATVVLTGLALVALGLARRRDRVFLGE